MLKCMAELLAKCRLLVTTRSSNGNVHYYKPKTANLKHLKMPLRPDQVSCTYAKPSSRGWRLACTRRQHQHRMHGRTAAASAQHRPTVHIAMIPLEGMESIEQTLGRLYPDVLALHCMVLVSAPPEDSTSMSGVHMFDFLPLNPTDPLTMARLVSGQSAQGQLRTRVLARRPRRRCWRVGPATGSLQVVLPAQPDLNAHATTAPAAYGWPVWPVCQCKVCVVVVSSSTVFAAAWQTIAPLGTNYRVLPAAAKHSAMLAIKNIFTPADSTGIELHPGVCRKQLKRLGHSMSPTMSSSSSCTMTVAPTAASWRCA